VARTRAKVLGVAPAIIMIEPELKDCGEVNYTYERMMKKTALLCVKVGELMDIHVAENDGRRIRTARIKSTYYAVNRRLFDCYLMGVQAVQVWLN